MLICAAVAAVLLAGPLGIADLLIPLVLSAFVVFSQNRLVVAGGRLYVRRGWWWSPPVDLATLRSVRLQRFGGWSTGNPLEPEMFVEDAEGRRESIGLWYWRHSCRGVAAVLDASAGIALDMRSEAAVRRLHRRCAT